MQICVGHVYIHGIAFEMCPYIIEQQRFTTYTVFVKVSIQLGCLILLYIQYCFLLYVMLDLIA